MWNSNLTQLFSSSLVANSGVVCLRALGKGALSFLDTLILLSLDIFISSSAKSGQGTAKKVKCRLVTSMDRDLSLQSILFVHYFYLCLSLESIASNSRAPADKIFLDCLAFRTRMCDTIIIFNLFTANSEVKMWPRPTSAHPHQQQKKTSIIYVVFSVIYYYNYIR